MKSIFQGLRAKEQWSHDLNQRVVGYYRGWGGCVQKQEDGNEHGIFVVPGGDRPDSSTGVVFH